MVGSAPVGHDQPIETPLVAQQGGEQPLVLGAVDAVQHRIRRHQRPHAGANHSLERREVHLAKRRVVDLVRHRHTSELHVVGHEVFGARANPFALHTVDVGDGELAGEERVFAERFEVAATEWVASEVDRGCEQNVRALPFRLASEQRTGLGYEVSVERGAEADRSGKAHGRRPGGGVTAGAVRAIGHLDRTDPEPFDLRRLPGIAARQQPDPLLHRQLLDRWPWVEPGDGDAIGVF